VARSRNPSLYLIYGSFLSISSTRWSHSSGTWTREYSTLPKKHKHKLKISVKVGYNRNEEGFLFHDFQMQKSHSTLEICEYWSVDLVCMGVFHLVSTPYPRTRSSN
jgi:hypothetical protein